MQEKPHPTHIRRMYQVMACFLIAAIFTFGAAFYVANPLDDRLETWFSVLFMILLLLVGLSACRFSYFSRCPQCHHWLLRDKLRAKGNSTLTFRCRSCQVIWDSRLKIDD